MKVRAIVRINGHPATVDITYETSENRESWDIVDMAVVEGDEDQSRTIARTNRLIDKGNSAFDMKYRALETAQMLMDADAAVYVKIVRDATREGNPSDHPFLRRGEGGHQVVPQSCRTGMDRNTQAELRKRAGLA